VNDQPVRESRGGFDMPKLAMGLFLVALGLAFLFDRLFWWDAHEFLRLWPVWLIGFGLLRVAYPREGRSRLAGFWPVLIGGIFLLDTLDVVPVSHSWPLFIVGAGILMMLKGAGAGRRRHRDEVVRERIGS
jgi:hypothetical protein